MQSNLPAPNRKYWRAFDDLVGAVARLGTANHIADPRNPDSAHGMNRRRTDDNAAVRCFVP
jgi:hypothetical protein